MPVEHLFQTPALAAVDAAAGRVVAGLRQWVAAHRTGACPLAAGASRLGSRRAGAHLHLLLEEIAAAWPEPFAVSPPCCRRLSHDEALLADMIALGRRADRPGFDRLLADLLPGETRERLFLSTGVLARMLED